MEALNHSDSTNHNAEPDDNNDEDHFKRRRPKSLMEPTANMLASQRELEKRKNEIKPKDDPFWEKRGGKGARFYPKYDNIEKSSKLVQLDQVTPLPQDSRLLTPTRAAVFGTYHKETPKKDKSISPLPVTSHLLTPTKASTRAEYHSQIPPDQPVAKSQPRDKSPPRENPSDQPSTSTLHDLTVNRKSAQWEKKEISVDPREHGWTNILIHPTKKSPTRNIDFLDMNPLPPPVDPATNPYKKVLSKLYEPTVASVACMWTGDADTGDEQTSLYVDDSGIERDTPGETNTNNGVHEARGRRASRGSRGSPSPSPEKRPVNKKYALICSRLMDTTVAIEASSWVNRDQGSPRRRHSIVNLPPPAVQAKPTKAQIYGQREKFVHFDDKDIGRENNRKKKSHRSSSAPPVPGRVYCPVPVSPHLASRAQLVQRPVRDASPKPRRRSSSSGQEGDDVVSEEEVRGV
jgi:hypothetical protein